MWVCGGFRRLSDGEPAAEWLRGSCGAGLLCWGGSRGRRSVRREAAGDEGAEGGVGAGDGVDGDAGGDGFGGDGGAGVGDAGHAGVGDYGDAAAGFEGFDEFGGAGVFVVGVVADGGGADAEVVEQLGGLAGVFAGDAVDGAEDAEGAEGDVFEVADGGGDEVEAGGEGAVVGEIGFGRCGLRKWGVVGHRFSRSLEVVGRMSLICCTARERLCGVRMPTMAPFSTTGMNRWRRGGRRGGGLRRACRWGWRVEAAGHGALQVAVAFGGDAWRWSGGRWSRRGGRRGRRGRRPGRSGRSDRARPGGCRRWRAGCTR